MHIQDALNKALDAATREGRLLCLVVDTAQAENSHQKLDGWHIPYASLFEGTPESSLVEVAPLLIPVNELAPDVVVRLFAWVEQLAYSAPCLSWFETDATLSAIADHLRHFHVVGLSDEQAMLMRWYDTRIMPVWFTCLTERQIEVFTAHSQNWHYVDRFGGVAALTVASHDVGFAPAPHFGQPLFSLTDEQYGLLVDAAELDVLLAHLRRVIPDETGLVENRQLTLFVARHQQAAIAAGVNDLDRQTQYVLLALYTSGEGLLHPAFKAFIAHPPKDLEGFHQRMQELPDEVWNAGQPLWGAQEEILTESEDTSRVATWR